MTKLILIDTLYTYISSALKLCEVAKYLVTRNEYENTISYLPPYKGNERDSPFSSQNNKQIFGFLFCSVFTR